MFAISHGVDLQCGRAYPRGRFTDLLIDILQGKGIDKRKAASQVRASLASSVACSDSCSRCHFELFARYTYLMCALPLILHLPIETSIVCMTVHFWSASARHVQCGLVLVLCSWRGRGVPWCTKAAMAAYLKPFVMHSHAQTALSALGLPFIAQDHGAALMGQRTPAIEVPDADIEIEDSCCDCDDFRVVEHRSPLVPLDMNAGTSAGVTAARATRGVSKSLTEDSVSDVASASASVGRSQGIRRCSSSFSNSFDAPVAVDEDSMSSALIPHGNIANIGRRWTVAKLKVLNQADYENMPQAQCALVASKASNALAVQSAKALEASKQVRALKRASKAREVVFQKKQRLFEEMTSKSALEVVQIGKTGTRMSTQSCFAIGLRRNLSNIAASDFGATILQSISHQRVCRSEVRTCAAILARMRSRCATSMSAMSSNEESWSILTVALRSDATNSSIWKREKLHILDCDVAYIVDRKAVREFNSDAAF